MDEYEVENIIDKRFNRGKVSVRIQYHEHISEKHIQFWLRQIQYRVKWLNFNNRYNSWVNLDDLKCDSIKQRFEDKHEIAG